jgi:phospholipid transport system substrate-binding protein
MLHFVSTRSFAATNRALGTFALTLFAVALFTLGVFRLPARAEPQASGAPGPMASVKAIIDQTIVVFEDKQIAPKDREEKLRSIAESHFDFEEMSRSAIGYHWRTFTPEQKAEFVPLFTKFIEDAYLSRIESYSVEKVDQQIKTSAINFTRETRDGEYAQVFSTVTLQDRANPIDVNYQMRTAGPEWKIYDISIDAISVIANYRNQFNRVLNNGGYDKLVTILRQKQQALGASIGK